MPDYSNCPCRICVYKEIGVYNNPCKECCQHTPPKGNVKEDYPKFIEDLSIKTLKTEDYEFGIKEFRLVD